MAQMILLKYAHLKPLSNLNHSLPALSSSQQLKLKREQMQLFDKFSTMPSPMLWPIPLFKKALISDLKMGPLLERLVVNN